MDEEYFAALAKVRMDSAKELLTDAAELLRKGFFKSAMKALYIINTGPGIILLYTAINIPISLFIV